MPLNAHFEYELSDRNVKQKPTYDTEKVIKIEICLFPTIGKYISRRNLSRRMVKQGEKLTGFKVSET